MEDKPASKNLFPNSNPAPKPPIPASIRPGSPAVPTSTPDNPERIVPRNGSILASGASSGTGSKQIDDIIKMYGGWKGELLARLRAVIKQADPAVVEEVKWKMPSRPEGLPVWYHDGMLCLAETFKNDIKLVFVKGAQMADPGGLFNARLKSKTDRAIEFHEGDRLDESALKALVIEATALNTSKAGQR
jgi:hypothetical protein